MKDIPRVSPAGRWEFVSGSQSAVQIPFTKFTRRLAGSPRNRLYAIHGIGGVLFRFFSKHLHGWNILLYARTRIYIKGKNGEDSPLLPYGEWFESSVKTHEHSGVLVPIGDFLPAVPQLAVLVRNCVEHVQIVGHDFSVNGNTLIICRDAYALDGILVHAEIPSEYDFHG